MTFINVKNNTDNITKIDEKMKNLSKEMRPLNKIKVDKIKLKKNNKPLQSESNTFISQEKMMPSG